MPGQYYRHRRRDSRCKSVFVPMWLVFSVLIVLILFINSSSNINRHVLLSFIKTAQISASLDSLQVVLKRIWCWTDGCLLSRLQQRGNVVPAWIVVIAHWTTVSLSTTSRLSRRLCLLYCPGGVPACFRQGHGKQRKWINCEVHGKSLVNNRIPRTTPRKLARHLALYPLTGVTSGLRFDGVLTRFAYRELQQFFATTYRRTTEY